MLNCADAYLHATDLVLKQGAVFRWPRHSLSPTHRAAQWKPTVSQASCACVPSSRARIGQYSSLFLRAGKDGAEVPSKYDLVANLCHDGKAGEGSYRVHIHRKVEEAWYEVQDLLVTDYLPQMVALSETYMQVWQLQSP